MVGRPTQIGVWRKIGVPIITLSTFQGRLHFGYTARPPHQCPSRWVVFRGSELPREGSGKEVEGSIAAMSCGVDSLKPLGTACKMVVCLLSEEKLYLEVSDKAASVD